jgi:hypothetical protein
MLREGTDRDGVPCIIFKPPTDIKQEQGGLTKSRGQRELEKNPEIKMYGNPYEPFLCPLQWWKADQVCCWLGCTAPCLQETLLLCFTCLLISSSVLAPCAARAQTLHAFVCSILTCAYM